MTMHSKAKTPLGRPVTGQRAVQFNSKTTSADPNATILAADRVLGEVGESSKSEPERMKRKLHACPYCVRSFTELEKMLQHLQTDHSDA